MQLEKTILKKLLKNEAYTRKVLPFLKDEYFSGEDRIIYGKIKEFTLKYNKAPTTETLSMEIDSVGGISEDEVKACRATLLSY